MLKFKQFINETKVTLQPKKLNTLQFKVKDIKPGIYQVEKGIKMWFNVDMSHLIGKIITVIPPTHVDFYGDFYGNFYEIISPKTHNAYIFHKSWLERV